MVQCVWPRGSLLSLILFLSRSSFSPESLSELPVRRVRSSCFDNHALLCLSTNVRFLQQKKKTKKQKHNFHFSHTRPDGSGCEKSKKVDPSSASTENETTGLGEISVRGSGAQSSEAAQGFLQVRMGVLAGAQPEPRQLGERRHGRGRSREFRKLHTLAFRALFVVAAG